MVHIWDHGAACDAVAVAWIILRTAGVGRIVTVVVVAAATLVTTSAVVAAAVVVAAAEVITLVFAS